MVKFRLVGAHLIWPLHCSGLIRFPFILSIYSRYFGHKRSCFSVAFTQKDYQWAKSWHRRDGKF